MKPTVAIMLFLGAILSAHAEGKFACPVTKPTPITFHPPGNFAVHPEMLFGNERLFTLLPGIWPYPQKSGRGFYVSKVVWGTAVFDLSHERERSELKITGRRLDAESSPLEFDGAHTAGSDEKYFITSGFYLPTLGCWEVTGHFHGTDLTVTIDVR